MLQGPVLVFLPRDLPVHAGRDFDKLLRAVRHLANPYAGAQTRRILETTIRKLCPQTIHAILLQYKDALYRRSPRDVDEIVLVDSILLSLFDLAVG